MGLTAGTVLYLAALSAAAPQTAAPPGSAAETYRIDPVHSVVMFRIRHLNVSWFYGRFNRVEGTFVLAAQPEDCRLEVTIDAAQIDTNHEDRDRHLRSEEFFHVEKYPHIRFVSQRFEADGADRWKVTGTLSLRGMERPVTVTVSRVGSGPDPWGGWRSGLESVFEIRRSDFGMDALRNGLGDEVRLFVALEGVRQ